MLSIDRNVIHKIFDYEFVNYVRLTKEEILQVLELRNREIVRKWMFSTDPIKEEDHLKFIKQLENRDDVYYWAIKQASQIVACFSVTNLNIDESSCETGIFFSDTSLKGFQVILDTLFCSYHLLFNELNIKRVDGYTNVNNKFMLALNQFVGFNVIESSDNDFCHQYIDAKLFQVHQQGKNNIRDFLKLLRNKK